MRSYTKQDALERGNRQPLRLGFCCPPGQYQQPEATTTTNTAGKQHPRWHMSLPSPIQHRHLMCEVWHKTGCSQGSNRAPRTSRTGKRGRSSSPTPHTLLATAANKRHTQALPLPGNEEHGSDISDGPGDYEMQNLSSSDEDEQAVEQEQPKFEKRHLHWRRVKIRRQKSKPPPIIIKKAHNPAHPFLLISKTVI